MKIKEFINAQKKDFKKKPAFSFYKPACDVMILWCLINTIAFSIALNSDESVTESMAMKFTLSVVIVVGIILTLARSIKFNEIADSSPPSARWR